MPMLLVTDEQFNKEVQKLNINKQPKVVDIQRGRGTNRLEIPSEIRVLVAEEALNGTKASVIASTFGISESSISAYKKDVTSTTNYNDSPNNDLKKSNDLVRESIISSARSKLMLALDSITAEAVGNAKVKDIASIAKDMSTVMKNVEPTNTLVNQNNTQVIVYRPRMRDEEEFETITINE